MQPSRLATLWIVTRASLIGTILAGTAPGVISGLRRTSTAANARR